MAGALSGAGKTSASLELHRVPRRKDTHSKPMGTPHFMFILRGEARSRDRWDVMVMVEVG